MHESEFDHKWENENDTYDRYEELEERYKQLKAEHEQLLAGVTELAPVEVAANPSLAESTIIILLMRLYDLNLALLKHFDRDAALKVYEAHDGASDFNPKIYVPNFGGDDEGN